MRRARTDVLELARVVRASQLSKAARRVWVKPSAGARQQSSESPAFAVLPLVRNLVQLRQKRNDW